MATEASNPTTEANAAKAHVCCPEFTPARIAAFDEKTIIYKDKPFVKETAWCFFYIPLNFGQAMKRGCDKIEKAGAAYAPDDFVMLCDMNYFSTNIHIGCTKDEIPDADVVKVSGTFLTKVFEGPFSNFNTWISELKEYAKKEKGEDFDVDSCTLYSHYGTCPKCAEKYGKNYVVLFMKVSSETE